jgi:hypothetical protein
MVDVRTLAAAVLGVALGLLFLVAPGTVIRVHTAGRVPGNRHGRYGEDGVSTERDADAESGGSGLPTRWRRLVQAAGAVLLLGGLYFGSTLM